MNPVVLKTTFSAVQQINMPVSRLLLTDTQVQTAFLLGMGSAAARARLPVRILALTISRWHSNAASGGQG